MIGADLASPNSQAQQDFLYSILEYGSMYCIFLFEGQLCKFAPVLSRGL